MIFDTISFFEKAILRLKTLGLYRKEEVVNRVKGKNKILFEKKEIISFSSNDYLNLSGEKCVIKAGIKALKTYGAGAGASKFIEGYSFYYEEIKRELLKMYKTEDALIFGSGYACNLSIFQSLSEVFPSALVFADELSHASTFDGIKLSGLKCMRFLHNDLFDLEGKILKYGNKCDGIIIATESVFSMKGDVADIECVIGIAKKYGGILITDEAHSLGAGVHTQFDLHIRMGTFSKGVGVLGGFVCASRNLIDCIRNFGRSGIYSTALPPSVLASVLASLKFIASRETECKKAFLNAQKFGDLIGYKAESHIIFLECGDSSRALQISQILQSKGFFIKAIRPPTVKRAGIRITFTRLHKKLDIQKLAFIINDIFKNNKL